MACVAPSIHKTYSCRLRIPYRTQIPILYTQIGILPPVSSPFVSLLPSPLAPAVASQISTAHGHLTKTALVDVTLL
ncbi:hypothetical protein K439DRAFT_1068746 [Ramaria rubella]|nr:hypothetical protein K439DRAFT_1068746 [Ramaria rubella]